MKPIPKNVKGWITEIRSAYADAAETISFGLLDGTTIAPSDLFHLAPVIMLKVRSLPRTKANLKTATEAALSTYVAATSRTPAMEKFPSVCFALAYLASHYAFDLVGQRQADEIMEYIQTHSSILVLSDKTFNRVSNERKVSSRRKKGTT